MPSPHTRMSTAVAPTAEPSGPSSASPTAPDPGRCATKRRTGWQPASGKPCSSLTTAALAFLRTPDGPTDNRLAREVVRGSRACGEMVSAALAPRLKFGQCRQCPSRSPWLPRCLAPLPACQGLCASSRAARPLSRNRCVLLCLVTTCRSAIEVITAPSSHAPVGERNPAGSTCPASGPGLNHLPARFPTLIRDPPQQSRHTSSFVA